MSQTLPVTDAEDLEVSIINDAAWVGYEISKALQQFGVKVRYMPRGRSVYAKSLKVFVNALRSRGIKHVNYALQDAFAMRAIGKRLHLLHCHGTDLFGLFDQRFMKESKDLSMWGWMIRGNLKAAGRVIVSTPDLLSLAKIIREDAEYIPNPIDTSRFSPKDYENKKIKAIGFNLWYESVPEELVKGMRRNGIEVDIFTRRPFPYLRVHEVMKSYDIFIDRMSVFSLSKTCLEAMSCGLATIDYRHRDDLDGRVRELVDESFRKKESIKNRDIIMETHDSMKIAQRFIQIYRELAQER